MTVLQQLQAENFLIKSAEAFDFTKFLGQYALKIQYTNGDTETFTTKSVNPNVSSSADFETTEQYFETLKYLQEIGKL